MTANPPRRAGAHKGTKRVGAIGKRRAGRINALVDIETALAIRLQFRVQPIAHGSWWTSAQIGSIEVGAIGNLGEAVVCSIDAFVHVHTEPVLVHIPGAAVANESALKIDTR